MNESVFPPNFTHADAHAVPMEQIKITIAALAREITIAMGMRDAQRVQALHARLYGWKRLYHFRMQEEQQKDEKTKS